MTSEDWMPNLHIACQTLLDSLAACEQELQKSRKEISAEIIWLNEITETRWRLFPGKSSTKTVKVNTANKITSDRPPCLDVNSKTACIEKCQQFKKATQKSRNSVSGIKPLLSKQSLTDSSVQEDSKENQPPVRQLSDEKGCRNNSRTVTRSKAYIPAASKKTVDVKGADKRLCTSAREAKPTINKGVLQRHGSTAGKKLVSSKLSSAGVKGSGSKMSCEQKSSGYGTVNLAQSKESSWRNSTLKNVQHGKCKPVANTCKSQQVAKVNVNSYVPAWNKTCLLSGQRQYSRNVHAAGTSRDMAAIFNGVKASHFHNQSLNETITVVTEVFELTGNGQPARLKEIEIVKTKTAPVERVVQPESTCMYTGSYSNPPSASSDQGFNDDDDCDQSMSASSEKAVTVSRKDSANPDDNVCYTEKEADELKHSLTDQNVNGIVSTEIIGTKTNKDSGIEADIARPAFVTKCAGHVKVSQARTTTQRDLANKMTSAEVTKGITRMGQRQNEDVTFSKNKSTNKPAAAKEPQRPKYCSSLDAKSMVIQKQKQQLLIVKTRAQEALKKAAEMRTQKIEEQKKLREEKKARDAMVRELETVSDHGRHDTVNKRSETELTVKEQVLEEKCKDKQDTQKLSSLQKQPETEANRKEEFRTERQQLLEQEEKDRVQEELPERNEKHLTTEQNTQMLEDNLVDLKQKLKEEKLRMRQAKEAKERETEQRRIEMEKQIAYEREEQLRIEREQKEERDRRIKEEFEKLKAMEKERLQQQQKLKVQHQEKCQSAKVTGEQKRSLIQKPPKENIANQAGALCNTNNSSVNSYVMTPVKKNSISSKSSDADNYGLEDKCSDQSTDDEEDPKKKIPEWATGAALTTALITQFFKPPDLEQIFRLSRIEPPNLELVFPGRRKFRYNYRTSSANWNSPPLKQH